MVEVGRDPAVVLDAGDGSRASSVKLYAPMTCFLRCIVYEQPVHGWLSTENQAARNTRILQRLRTAWA